MTKYTFGSIVNLIWVIREFEVEFESTCSTLKYFKVPYFERTAATYRFEYFVLILFVVGAGVPLRTKVGGQEEAEDTSKCRLSSHYSAAVYSQHGHS